jgi:hypothetical protein
VAFQKNWRQFLWCKAIFWEKMISSRDDRDQVVYWKYLEFCDRHKVESDPTVCISLYVQTGSLQFSRNSEGHQVIPVLELAKEGHLSWVEELSYNCN